jgi:hypothetical protein
MESIKMNVRHILVAASAAAILAGSSYGALAYQQHHNYSKPAASSYSHIEVDAYFKHGKPKVSIDGVVKTNASDDSAAGGNVTGEGEAEGGSHSNNNNPLAGILGMGGNGGSHGGNSVSAEGTASGFSCSGGGCSADVNIDVNLSGNGGGHHNH